MIRKQERQERLLLLLLLGIALFCEAAWLVSVAPTDVTRYECYSLTFWLGSYGTTLLPQTQCTFLHITTPIPPFHMLPLEYPPLTILIFSLPLLAPLPYYTLSFALLMTLTAGLIYWLLARSNAPKAAPIYLLYLILGTIAVVQERFDLLPAACTLICLLAATQKRWKTAYIALALGVLLKLYPLIMLPSLFLAEQQTYSTSRDKTEPLVKRWQNSLLFAGLLIVVTGSFALLNFNDALVSPLAYFLQRPPQIESLASSVIWLGSHFGVPYTIVFSFGSLNLQSTLTRFISPIDTLLTLIGTLTLLWLQLRQRINLTQALTGLICILLVTGKVFSPQYLIWLIPLLAYLHANGQTNRLWMTSWATIALLTTLIYLLYYPHLPNPNTAPHILPTLPGFFELVASRNLLLLVTVLAFFIRQTGTNRIC
jgi:hypothetical protein